MSFFDDLLGGGGMEMFGGGGGGDNPYANIALPKEVTDPLYTSSQAGLNDLGSGLLKGDVPDYYKSIGDFNSPQFQAMLNSVKGQIMQGSQEASAIAGTGRSGVGVTASNNALNQVLPQLGYQDYLRAVQGRGALLSAGIGVQQGVRGAAQNQQQFDSDFNQTLFKDQVGLTGLSDAWMKDAAKSQGEGMANLLPVAGTVLGGVGGFFMGGPAGAITGAQLGSQAGGALGSLFGGTGSGGGSDLSSLFSSLSGMGKQSATASGSPLLDQSGLGSFSLKMPTTGGYGV